MDRRDFLRGLFATIVASKVDVTSNLLVQHDTFNASLNEHLIRSNIWNKQLRDMIADELFNMKFSNVVYDEETTETE